MKDWAPPIIASALFALLCPGGILPADARQTAAGGLDEHEDQLGVHRCPCCHLRPSAHAVPHHPAGSSLHLIPVCFPFSS
ncbi:hypothetical protein GUJ93_ZPchr0001g32676 [Zizania palustris]|uniref:Secreted protein n=1 Tax=Zizania palustris TaxID=103762 RepID=A0A8J5V8S4_ZIZPA|nr:hypothetical protein GUJ93_ZPchr0001g32676 [Zizania palustris]